MLTKAELLAKTERRFVEVPLPSGGDVRVRSLKRAEHRAWRKSFQKKNGDLDVDKFEYSDDVLIAMSLVDDKGAELFSIKDALGGCFDDLDDADVNAIRGAVTKLNNMNALNRNEIEAAVKNSEATPGNDSSSDSAVATA